MNRFIIKYFRAPGDTLVLTALIRDLKLTYGDDIQLDVRTRFPDMWRNNPHLTPLADGEAPVVLLNEVKYITQSQRGIRLHYLTAFFRDFTAKTGLRVQPSLPKGDIHLSDVERTQPLVAGRYWVIIPGGKLDVTIKFWPTENYQEVVRLGRERGWRFVQEGAAKPRHVHPPLTDALSMVGMTNIRDLMVNIYHSDGVVCGITFPMHVAGALDKPCVVVAGGREEPWWEQYANLVPGQFGTACAAVAVPHHFLHTLGKLDCCQSHGCWRQRTVKLPDGHPRHNSPRALCSYPVAAKEQAVAKCMQMVTPQMVVNAMASYGDPPPIEEPTIVRSPAMMASHLAKPQAVQQQRLTQSVAQVSQSVAQVSQSVAQMTCCILMHGREAVEHAMHRKCLESILASVPPGSLDFRIACNQVGADTLAMLEQLPNVKLYCDDGDRRKYPAMREMFHDPANPITTDWTLWFDDDTYVVDSTWYERLTKLQRECAADVGSFGIPLFSRLNRGQLAWFTQASWYRRREFRTAQGKPAPNGNCIHFPVGWFWSIRTAAIAAADIPCRRLNHNGGDVTIGEQLYQAGYTTKPFNVGKSHIYTPPKSRRGYSETPPWV